MLLVALIIVMVIVTLFAFVAFVMEWHENRRPGEPDDEYDW